MVVQFKIKKMENRKYVKIGVGGGPVGSGKTALLERLSRRLLNELDLAVITNDVYTKEDAEFMAKIVYFRVNALLASKQEGAHTQLFVKMPV